MLGVIARTALVTAALLLAACTGGGDAAPDGPASTASPGATDSAAIATPPPATRTPTPDPPTPTPEPTQPPPPTPPPGQAIFCQTEVDGVAGFVRGEQCGFGFVTVLTPEVDAAITVGDFLPSCLSPTGDGSFVVTVGRLCAHRYQTITDNPLPPELRGSIADGDLVPSCATGGAPDWEITVGPPCVLGGLGAAEILIDPAPLDALSDCTAALLFMSLLVPPYERLSVALAAQEAGVVVGPAETGLRAAGEELAAFVPYPRAVRNYEGWGERSPLVIRERTLGLLNTLLVSFSTGTAPDAEALAELSEDVDAATAWFTAGRGCS